MRRVKNFERRAVSFGGYHFLFLILLSSVFLSSFFLESARRTSEVMREDPVNAVNLARIILVGFVGFCTISILFLRSYQFGRNFRGPLGWMFVYGAIALISSVYSSLPLVSAGKAFEILVDVFFFMAVSSFCCSLELVSLWNLLLTFLCALLIAVWASALILPSVGFIRIPGALLPLQLQGALPSIDPNDLGEISAIVAVTGFCRILVKRRSAHRDGFLWGGVFLLALLSLIFAQARTSVVGLVVALVGIQFITRKLGLLPLFALCGGALLVYGGREALLQYYMRGQTSGEFYSMTGRIGIWEAAWSFFKQSPLFGHGFYTAHRLDLNVRLSGVIDISNIDNTFLEVMLGVGLIGLLPILAALLKLVGGLMRISRRVRLPGHLGESKCEIVAVLVIVLIRAINGPTFQDHSINLLILLISMAFVQILIKPIRPRLRSRVRLNESYQPLAEIQ
jgi:O-antigen ligase